MHKSQNEDSITLLRKFTEYECNIHRLKPQYPRYTVKELEQKIQYHIKDIIIDIQEQLRKIGKIQTAKFFDDYNPHLMKQMMNLDKILDFEATTIFLLHYEERIKQLNNSMRNVTGLTVKSKLTNQKRLYVYQMLMKYALQNQLFTNFTIGEQEKQLQIQGYMEYPQQIYCNQKLRLLYGLYENKKGCMDNIIMQVKIRYRWQTSGDNLVFRINNLKLIGCYYIYKASLEAIDAMYLSWGQFKQIYLNIFKDWNQQLQAILLRVAVYNDASQQEIKDVCLQLALSYLIKFQGFSFHNNDHPNEEHYNNIDTLPHQNNEDFSESELQAMHQYLQITKKTKQKPKAKGKKGGKAKTQTTKKGKKKKKNEETGSQMFDQIRNEMRKMMSVEPSKYE